MEGAMKDFLQHRVVTLTAIIGLGLPALFALPAVASVSGRVALAPGLRAATPTRQDSGSPMPRLGGWGSARNRALSSRILAAHSWLWRHGIEVRQWGPDPASAKIKVWLVRYSPAARQALLARYGSAIVVSSQVIRDPRLLLNRWYDQPAFAGGDVISTPLGYCTLGPMIVENGSNPPVDYSITAGHCANLGDTIKTANNWTVGKVVNRYDSNNTADTEKIDAYRGSSNYLDAMWNGGQAPNLGDGSGDSSPGLYYEDHATFPSIGQGVTNDSAFTGEINDITVHGIDESFCFSANNCIAHLSEADRGTSAESCEPGDSGGPWIVREDGTEFVQVAGTTDIGADPVAGTDGYALCYYTQIYTILNDFNSYVP
jgi:hypothetical protein